MSSAHDPALVRAAQGFEGAFLTQVYQTMFATVPQPRGPLSGGHAEGMWRSIMVDEMAKATARAGGLGVAETMLRQLGARE